MSDAKRFVQNLFNPFANWKKVVSIILCIDSRLYWDRFKDLFKLCNICSEKHNTDALCKIIKKHVFFTNIYQSWTTNHTWIYYTKQLLTIHECITPLYQLLTQSCLSVLRHLGKYTFLYFFLKNWMHQLKCKTDTPIV